MLLLIQLYAGAGREVRLQTNRKLSMAHIRYVGARVANKNCKQEEIKKRLDSGNPCYHSVEIRSSSCLLSKHIKIRIYNTIVCLWFCLTIREEYRLEGGSGGKLDCRAIKWKGARGK
jgi:hypothetical protein